MRSQFVEPRNVDVWLPDEALAGTACPVIYFHDGQMLFDSTTTWNLQEWQLDETATKLIQSQQIRPFIAVAIWNTPNRHREYFPEAVFNMLPASFRDSLMLSSAHHEQPLFPGPILSDEYLRFIVQELKPFIDSNYASLPNETYIGGASMGGLISMYALCSYPEVFRGAICMSTHWPGIFRLENNPIPQTFVRYLETTLPDPGYHLWYFDRGTATLDALYGHAQEEVDALFSAKGYDQGHFVSYIFSGEDHSEKAWAKRLDKPLQFLLFLRSSNNQ